MPKKRMIIVAVVAALLALTLTVPFVATGCGDDDTAYQGRMAGRMMDRGDANDCQGRSALSQGRGNGTDCDGANCRDTANSGGCGCADANSEAVCF